MRRLEEGGIWTFFGNHQAEQLSNTYGPQFDQLYESFESAGLGLGNMSAQILWTTILQSQIRTGGPSLLYKDAVNGKYSIGFYKS
jgi:hypothetical protein